MTILLRALPLEALGSQTTLDTAFFRREIEKLDRTEALVLAAKLNIITSNMVTLDPLESQDIVWRLLKHDKLIDNHFVTCIEDYIKQNGRHAYIARISCLELYRWLSLWGKDEPKNAFLAEGSQAKKAFIRCLIMALEFNEKRILRIDASAPDDDKVFQGLLAFRTMSLSNTTTTNIFALIGRSSLLMDNHFYRLHPEYRETFEATAGLTLDEYRECATAILTTSLAAHAQQLTTLKSQFEFTLKDYCTKVPTMQTAFEQFLRYESTTSELLAERFAGNDLNSFLDFRVFRERPIFEIKNGRHIVLDPNMLAHRATYGPLFYPISDGQKKFDDFGDAFESYIQDEFKRRYISLGCTEEPIIKPYGKYADSKNKREIADVVLVHPEGLVLLEIKGGSLPDRAISLASAQEFFDDLNEKYGISKDGKKRKGLAQLADSIKSMIDGELSPENDCIRPKINWPIFPVLLVHDVHLVCHYFGNALAREFVKILGENRVPNTGWLEYKGYRIYSLIVMSVDEFENLEHFGDNQDIIRHLRGYSDKEPIRYDTFREYIVGQQNILELKDESHAMKVGYEFVSRMNEKFFGKPLSKLSE